MRLKRKPTAEEEAAFISGAKADMAEAPSTAELITAATSPALQPAAEPSIPTVTALQTEPPPAPSPVDPHQFVRRTEWPILPSLDPFMADGRTDLDKPFVMRMKEDLWNSIDRHCKALGVDKSKWIRQAILNQMAAEQQHFSTEAAKK